MLAPGCLLLLSLLSASGAGSSIFEEGPGNFQLGVHDGTRATPTGIELEFNQSASGNWTKRETRPAPAPRELPGMSFDSGNGVAVLFGGGEPYTNDTWIYNFSADSWTEMKPVTAPPSRMGHSMAYDSAFGVMVLFGGIQYRGGYTMFNDTWVYNLSTNTWTQMHPPVSPPNRSSHRMVYDSGSGLMILFGGANHLAGMTDYNDTWTYDLATDEWANMSPHSAPSPRYLPGMVYDGDNGIAVLFGGFYEGYVYDDTWSYNLSVNDWTLRNPSSAPSSRAGHAMTYDSDNGLVFLFGGSSPDMNDTWTYDSNEDGWTQLNPHASPPANNNQGMVYDDQNKAVVMFAGIQADNDTWIYRSGGYVPSGSFTSGPYDTGGQAYFGALGWNGSAFPGTAISFQLRTADSLAGISGQEFIGPDGTPGTFYGNNGQRLSPVHNGTRWLQYRAYLATEDPFLTPFLINVTVKYNLLQSVAILSPAGSERWSGMHDIRWTADDPDNDTLRFDIYLQNGTQSKMLVSDIDGTTWEWDTATACRGNFRIRIVARDNDPDIPLSAEATSKEFTVFNNRPPVARLQEPADGSVVPADTILIWTGEDADDDPISYFVFLSDVPFDRDSLPPQSRITGQASFTVTDLAEGRDYYWTVVPNDGMANGSVPEVWRFRTDRPPTISLISPQDKSEINALSVRFSWHCADPDGDPLYFMLRLAQPSIDKSTGYETSNESLVVGNLIDGESYIWSVAVFYNVSKSSPVASEYRSFTVRIPDANHPISITGTPADTAWTGQLYTYNITTADEDDDIPAFSLVQGPPDMTLDRATGQLRWTPDTADIGNHSITIQASDGRGSPANQTFTLRVLETPARPQIPPTCKISSPANGSKVGALIEIRGTATAGRLPLSAVLVRIDGGAWKPAVGLENWTFSMNTASLSDGRHRIEARSSDGSLYSNATSVDILVRQPEPVTTTELCPVYIPIMLIVATAVFIVYFLAGKRLRA